MSPNVSAVSTDASGTRANLSPAMLDIEHVGEVFNMSTRHVRRLVDAGKFPQPVRLGGCVRWPRHVIEAWIADGCPSNCRKRPGVSK